MTNLTDAFRIGATAFGAGIYMTFLPFCILIWSMPFNINIETSIVTLFTLILAMIVEGLFLSSYGKARIEDKKVILF